MARTSKGRIFKKGRSFYIQYYVQGREVKHALRNTAGEVITKEREAQEAADLELAPLRFKSRAQRLEHLVGELATVEEKTKIAADRIINSSAKVADAWNLYAACPSCLDSVTRYKGIPPHHSAAGNRRRAWLHFAEWLTQTHPDILTLDGVTARIAEEYHEFMKNSNGTAPSMINYRIAAVRNLFKTLIADERLIVPDEPFRRVKFLPVKNHSKSPLTVEQVYNLLQAAQGDMKTLFAIGYFTGLRLGDACTLRWNEVDILRGVIERVPRKLESRVRDVEQIKIKVGIAPFLLKRLLEIPRDKDGYVLPEIAERYLKCRLTIRNRVNKVFHEAGIETQFINEQGHRQARFGFHSLRYSFVSHNQERGVPSNIVQRAVGHLSPSMTYHYSIFSDETAREYAAKLTLPEPPRQIGSAADVIDVTPTASPSAPEPAAEPERATLRSLADSLPVEAIREILKLIKGEIK